MDKHIAYKRFARQEQAKRKRQRALKASRGRCHYCGKHLTPNTVTLDHKVPKARGGRNTKWNLVAACASCNGLKADMSYGQFIRLLERQKAPCVDGGRDE